LNAQEFCFHHAQNTISFETKGSIVRFGVWTIQDASGSRNYLFYGNKKGNSLEITFIDTIPNVAVQRIFLLKNDGLDITMKTESGGKQTTKFLRCENDAQVAKNVPDVPCACVAYINELDTNGLNIRKEGHRKAAIVAKIPNADGTKVLLTSSSKNGWIAIDNVPYDENKPVATPGYVFAQKLGISTAGYELGTVPLFAKPSKEKILRSIPADKHLTILDCADTWLKVQYKQYIGWIALDDQCPNKILNCNN
jgi:hypothetical protein